MDNTYLNKNNQISGQTSKYPLFTNSFPKFCSFSGDMLVHISVILSLSSHIDLGCIVYTFECSLIQRNKIKRIKCGKRAGNSDGTNLPIILARLCPFQIPPHFLKFLKLSNDNFFENSVIFTKTNSSDFDGDRTPLLLQKHQYPPVYLPM